MADGARAGFTHRRPLLCVLVMALGACGTLPPPQVGPVEAAPVAEMGQGGYSVDPAPVYRLRPSDVLSLKVFREPDLSFEELPVGADGTIVMPLIGQLRAQGLTLSELTGEVTRQLDDAGLKQPSVAINVIDYGSHVVTVEGGVTRPGVYDFKPGARLSSAIALANGPNRVARLRDVAVFRDTGAGIEVAKFDFAAVSQGTMIDPVIEPGDRVVVGMSGLSQFWQDLLRALPAFGMFTRVDF